MKPSLLTGAVGLTIAVLGCVTISFAVQVSLQRRTSATADAWNSSCNGPRDLLFFLFVAGLGCQADAFQVSASVAALKSQRGLSDSRLLGAWVMS